MVSTTGIVADTVGGTMPKNKDYDINTQKFHDDLKKGEEMEELFKEFMLGKNIEVKSERHIWENTRNHFVEYSYKPIGKDEWERSGIAATKSEYWCVFLVDELENPVIAYIVRVADLKKIVCKYLQSKRDVVGGDGDRSKGVLVPIDEIAGLAFKS
jgi:hypothetical protein